MPSPAAASHQATYRTIANHPEPPLGTRAEAIKAALKAHRDLSRVQLNTKQTSATGVQLGEWFVWLIDVWRTVETLPPVQRAVVQLYFLQEAGRDPFGRPCQASNEEVAAKLGLSERYVRTVKREAVDRITQLVWPFPEGEAPALPQAS